MEEKSSFGLKKQVPRQKAVSKLSDLCLHEQMRHGGMILWLTKPMLPFYVRSEHYFGRFSLI